MVVTQLKNDFPAGVLTGEAVTVTDGAVEVALPEGRARYIMLEAH